MLTRRVFAIGAPLALAGCVSVETPLIISSPADDPRYRAMYGTMVDAGFTIPAVDLRRIVSPEVLRREVDFPTRELPGTIIVDPGDRFAYFVLPGGRAIRYGVGVGKVDAFNFVGEARVARKAAWPRWTPTPAMIRREPARYLPHAGGMAGGPANPLGARALYLYRGGRDTLYRLHGTNEPTTIGTRVSSGCVRFFNQDIIDLYQRVQPGAKVIVLRSRASAGA